ncbi:aromatase/cyclase [Amycolatopsis magusensis]|uniref:aromatase/cyclase n=1 Tax=Amycolatopsis magusensis TaxID=882444 RepID=UPI00378B5249
MSHETQHETTIAAPARAVYELIANIADWPRIFPPTVHTEYVERGKTEERIRIWAMANGEPRGWLSRRQLDKENLRIRFRQEVSQPPVAAMGGEWLIDPVSDTETRVRLTHDFDAVNDDADNVSLITLAIDRNSTSELAALKSSAESRSADLLLTFEDSLRVKGSASDVYDFIYAASQWEARLPHVARIALQEDTPNVQVLEMDTRSGDGDVHTTKSVRICFPADRIVYKQIEPPALLSVHNGQWTISAEAGSTLVTSAHTVVIKPDAIGPVLGEQATVADARDLVRNALGRNSTTTLQHAKAYVETR